MIDLLLPTTDSAVVVQLLVVLAIAGSSLLAFWRRAEIRVLVVGLTLVLIGLMGVRALH